MPPFEHALLAVDAEPDVVLAAGRRLRDGERAARAAFELDQRGRVVDDLAAGHQRADVGDHAASPAVPTRTSRDAARGSRWRSSRARGRSARDRAPSAGDCSAGRPRGASRGRSGCTRPGPGGSPRAHRRARVAARSGSSGTRNRRARSRRSGRSCRVRATRSHASSKSCVTGLSPTTSSPASSAAAAYG